MSTESKICYSTSCISHMSYSVLICQLCYSYLRIELVLFLSTCYCGHSLLLGLKVVAAFSPVLITWMKISELVGQHQINQIISSYWFILFTLLHTYFEWCEQTTSLYNFYMLPCHYQSKKKTNQTRTNQPTYHVSKWAMAHFPQTLLSI